MDNSQKINELAQIISGAKTFSGLDLKPLPFFAPWKNEEQDYIRIDDNGQQCYLPKNQHALDMESKGGFIDKIKDRWASIYEARGLKFTDISEYESNLLKDVFGNAFSSKRNGHGETFNATLFTNIDKKGSIEVATERGFIAAGAVVSAPGSGVAAAAVTGAGAVTGSLKGASLVLGKTAIVGLAVGTVASLGVGSALSYIPKVLDKISDAFNGDEREIAMQFAQSKLQGGNLEMVTQIGKNVPLIKNASSAEEIAVEQKKELQNSALSSLINRLGLGSKLSNSSKQLMP